MLAGVLAGLFAFAFAFVFAEPQIDRAIAFEEQMSKAAEAANAGAPSGATAAAAPAEEGPIVSRKTQASTGLLTGLVGYGAAIGGIFALVFAIAYGRLGTLKARATSALLALLAFVSVTVVPQLKYPANPPAVGSDDTIGARTLLFFVLLAVSIALAVAAVNIARRLWNRRGAWIAGLLGTGAYLVGIAVLFAAMPPINEMPDGFPQDVITSFRVASLVTHALLWIVIGVVFGHFAERLLEAGSRRRLAGS
jgi:predicted cobalt transporter CbtA